MKKILYACAILIALCISSCQDEKNLYQEEPEKEVNASNFVTKQQVKLTVDYSKSNAKVLFYVYDKNPLTFNGNTVSMDESIKPLDAAWTNNDGQFSGSMDLPTYVSEVYLVSTAYYAQTVLKGTISNGTLSVSDVNSVPVSRANNTKYEDGRFKKLGWKDVFGGYDPKTGEIEYAYQGNDAKLVLSPEELADMKATVGSVIAIHKTCPMEYRMMEGDLVTSKDDTEIVLTSLGGNTCWNNSLGYYFYKDGETPTSLKDVDKYTIFPNCQSGWTRGTADPIVDLEGTAVQLKYFDDENPEGTTYFPKGYRIGFVLACNAWDYYYNGKIDFMASSTLGLSTPVKGVSKAHTAMFSKGDIIAIGFEDHKDDENFSDVIFAVKARPAITNIPGVDEENNTTVKKGGIYGFEDEWPKGADYDMNDVMAEYGYEKTFTPENIYIQESFTFKTYANRADLKNGLALILKQPTLTGEVIVEDSIMLKDESEFSPASFAREDDKGNVIVKFTDNVKSNMNATYKVTIKYDKSIKKGSATEMDAFIYRPSNGKQLEVHCPMQAPTSMIDESLFGTKDDCSDPDGGIYYVSDKENLYPFAFYLDNANVEDIAPMLEPANESVPISDLYPKFIEWAKNNGVNQDWYKRN